MGIVALFLVEQGFAASYEGYFLVLAQQATGRSSDELTEQGNDHRPPGP